MGFYSGLAAEKYDRQYSNRLLLRRIMAYAKPFLPRLVIVTLIIILKAALETAPNWVVSKILDNITLFGDPAAFILLLSLLILVMGIAGYLLNFAQQKIMIRIVTGMVLRLATDAFRASTQQDLSFHDLFQSGKIVSRITTDTRDFGSLISMTAQVISQFLQSLIVAILLLTIDWRLSLILFTMMPIIVVFMIFYRRFARKITRQGMRAMANVNSTIKETVSGIVIAKNFRQEGSIFKTFAESNQTSYKVNVRRGLALSIMFPIMRTIGGIMTGVLVYYGSGSVVKGLITAGAWYLFLLSIDRFMMPILNITSYWTNVQTGLSAAERVFALIDAEHSVKQTGDVHLEKLTGKIDFRHLNFRYSPDTDLILDDLDLNIPPGESLAIVGHTGAGKTSIARLITRFYEFQEGELLIDDQDIRSLNLETLRRNMGIVTQVPFLFSGTVIENIRYANKGCSLGEIQSLAHQIGDGEWVSTLPAGFDTQVGERGAHLSMGQRQLVALMRVLVQKPAIFILDEATASIDPFTEKQIQAALKLILKNATSILIAHRLSTVRSADRIIVVESGKIIEEGNHDTLLGKNGYYAGLYNTYFRHQSLAYVESSRNLLTDLK